MEKEKQNHYRKEDTTFHRTGMEMTDVGRVKPASGSVLSSVIHELLVSLWSKTAICWLKMRREDRSGGEWVDLAPSGTAEIWASPRAGCGVGSVRLQRRVLSWRQGKVRRTLMLTSHGGMHQKSEVIDNGNVDLRMQALSAQMDKWWQAEGLWD